MTASLSLCKRPGRPCSGPSPSAAKCRPVPGAPQSRMRSGPWGLPSPTRRAAHGPHDAVHEGVLPQHHLFHLSGQPFEAAQMLLSDFGGAFWPADRRPPYPQASFRLWHASRVVSLRNSAFCFSAFRPAFSAARAGLRSYRADRAFPAAFSAYQSAVFLPGRTLRSSSSPNRRCMPSACLRPAFFPTYSVLCPLSARKSLENPRAGGYTNFILI